MMFTRAFLSNREIRTYVHGLTSSWYPINTGTPQGSVMGPIFFLVYINDLLMDIDPPITTQLSYKHTTTALGYADDILVTPRVGVNNHTMITPNSTTQTTANKHAAILANINHYIPALQTALDYCSKWADNWTMRFSMDKTNSFLVNGLTTKTVDTEFNQSLTTVLSSLYLKQGGKILPLSRVHQYSYMGVIWNDNVHQLFRYQFIDIMRKLQIAAKPIRQILRLPIPIKIGKLLIQSKILSVKNYALEIIRYSPTQHKKIDKFICNLARDVLMLPNHTRLGDMFMELGFLPNELQHQYQLLSFAHRITDKPKTNPTRMEFYHQISLALSKGARGELNNNNALSIPQEIRKMTGQFTRIKTTEIHTPPLWSTTSCPHIFRTMTTQIIEDDPSARLKSLILEKNENTILGNINTHTGDLNRGLRGTILTPEIRVKLRNLNDPTKPSSSQKPQLGVEYSTPLYFKTDTHGIDHIRAQIRCEKLITNKTAHTYYSQSHPQWALSPMCYHCRLRGKLIEATIDHTILNCPNVKHLVKPLKIQGRRSRIPLRNLIRGQFNAPTRKETKDLLVKSGLFLASVIEFLNIPITKSNWIPHLDPKISINHFHWFPP